MATFTFGRDKNFILIQTAEDKTYKFDVNTVTMYGIKGKPINSVPTGLWKYIDENRYYPSRCPEILSLLYDFHRTAGNASSVLAREHRYDNSLPLYVIALYNKYFNFADRILSLGYSIERGGWVYNTDEYEFINQHFKQFAKAFRDDPSISLHGFYTNCSQLEFTNKYRNIPDVDNEMINFVYNCFKGETESKIRLVFHYLTHGVWEYYHGVYQQDMFCYSGYSAITSAITTYFDLCDKLNIAPEKDNFFKLMVDVSARYRLAKASLDKQAIIDNYKDAIGMLSFEDDEFTVIIPQTVEEFSEEAKAQDNCVYRLYLPKVINHETYVVFIRKKSNLTKSFITCEVAKETRNIRQFYLSHNRMVNDNTPEAKFRKAYQTHLREHC